MSTLTLDALKDIMRRSSGVAESADLTGEIGGIPFRDLGYDSLAVLEIASQVQRDYGLFIPDEAIEQMTTPGAVVSYVNAALASV